MVAKSEPTIRSVDVDGQVVRRATIRRSAADLYAIVATPELHSEIDGSGTVGNVVRSDVGQVREGSTFTIKMKMYGMPYKIKSRVTRAVPGRVLEWRHPQGHHWRWEFTPAGDGATEVTHSFDYRGNMMKGMLELMGVMRSNGAGMERSLRNLATVSAPKAER